VGLHKLWSSLRHPDFPLPLSFPSDRSAMSLANILAKKDLEDTQATLLHGPHNGDKEICVLQQHAKAWTDMASSRTKHLPPQTCLTQIAKGLNSSQSDTMSCLHFPPDFQVSLRWERTSAWPGWISRVREGGWPFESLLMLLHEFSQKSSGCTTPQSLTTLLKCISYV
jgi:hypothetical protein